jgi:uncharacterized protein YcbX
MGNPSLHSIHVHPLKAARGFAPDEAVVEPWGLVDDSGKVITQRPHPRMALAAAGLLPGGGLLLSASGRAPLAVPAPEPTGTVTVEIWRDKVEAVPADAAAHAWFSDHLGVPVRLVHLDDPATRRPLDPEYARPGETVSFADGYPLLLTSTASLDAVNDWLLEAGDEPVPMTRFRPNVVITGARAWAEDDWLGHRVRLGGTTFRAAKSCSRCVVTTVDQETGEVGRQPLRALGRHRRYDAGLLFGINLIPDIAPGETEVIRVGESSLALS